MGVYDKKPDPFLIRISVLPGDKPRLDLSCAGYDGGKWRGKGLANYLMSWLPDYALNDEQLQHFTHASGWTQFREAAARIYTTKYADKRGEIGEISLHAICRQHFNTVPLVPRVFYLTGTNELVKGFDLVHYRNPHPKQPIELWLGESKFYKNRSTAIADAIASLRKHIDHGFLKNDKLLIGPQIPHSTPRYEDIRAIFRDNTPIDDLKARAVFPIGIFAESPAVKSKTNHDAAYFSAINAELSALSASVVQSGLTAEIQILLIYVPLLSKSEIIKHFDSKLKAIQDD